MALKPGVGPADHKQGAEQASIQIVEYGDYECPHCGAAQPIIKEIEETFGSQILFVFRNFPLQETHPLAMLAAQVAEAAGKQGKFWEMHDAIYDRQSQLDEDMLLSLGAEIGLDTDLFEQDVADSRIREKIESDFESGVRSGVNGTPSFFVNGQKFDGGATDLYAMLEESVE